MRTVLRALIVDDEAPARELLRALLASHRNVEVVGEANCIAAAASLYTDLRPEIVFLDVQMPNGDGFSLLPKLRPMPAVIFVTAYEKFAVRAFEVNAVDYLLKPFRPERLADALQRIVHSPKPVQVGHIYTRTRFFSAQTQKCAWCLLLKLAESKLMGTTHASISQTGLPPLFDGE